MKMSKGLTSCIGIKVAQFKVMCGLSVDSEAIEDKAVNAVAPDPIGASKFLSVFKQRLKAKQLEVEFKAIGKSCEDHAANAALRNVLLNVKQDVVTYDHSRVIVWDIPASVGTDYYNASFVDGYNGPKEYIAVQGPSSKCLASFWHLVWQEGVTCIVMATGLFENAVQQCDKYWVDHTRKYARHGDIHIWHERSVYLAKLNIRTFRIQKNGSCESRLLTHFEMVGFREENPDPGLVLEVRRRVNALAATQPGPVLVHCRCGGGRTAVYISVDFCLHQLQAEDRVDVFNTVLHLRRFRRGMVRTLGQYTQIYKAVAMYLQCGVTVHPALTLPATVHVHYHLGGDSTKYLRLEKEFHTLQSIVPTLSIGDCASGHRVENRSKSRDIMMLPPECARPYLTTADCGDSGTDFINAVYVDGYHFENAYMVTQWPMKRTMADLWRLLFDFKITSLILMNDVRKFSRKYPRFWPKDIDQVVSYGPISVRYLYCERKPNLTVRTFTIRKPKRHPHLIANALMSISDDVMVLNSLVGCETRMDEIVVKLFQVIGQPTGVGGDDCPSHGGPKLRQKFSSLKRNGRDHYDGGSDSEDQDDSLRRRRIRTSSGQRPRRDGTGLSQWSESLLTCMEQVSEWQRRAGSRQPVCVVSKDGSSRVGAYCAIAVACDQARVEKEVDVFNAVRLVRKNRPQLVPNIEEYQFIYRFMADYITQSNSKPEIVISEPEVTPDCFSPLLSLSTAAPVVRSHFGGISVAAPGKIFTPPPASISDKGKSYVTSPSLPPDRLTQPWSYRDGDLENNKDPNISGRILQEGQRSFHETEDCGHSEKAVCKESENVLVDQQCKQSGSKSSECSKFNTERCGMQDFRPDSCANKNVLNLKDGETFKALNNNSSADAFCKSSKVACSRHENSFSYSNHVSENVCNFRSRDCCSCDGKAFPKQSSSDHNHCQQVNESCITNHEHCHCQGYQYVQMSLSQSHISPQPNTYSHSPWFNRTRSKPSTPQRKVSWPPPAALSPGQYISPPRVDQTPPAATFQLDGKFAPPPAPPPTPCLRLGQLSTCTSSTSFYSCRSQLSVSTANPTCCHNIEISISGQFQHCCTCCRSGRNSPNSSNISQSNIFPSIPHTQPLNDCQCVPNNLHHNNGQNCSSQANINGHPQFLSSYPSSTIQHLDVPKQTRSETKASIHYFSSLATQPKDHCSGDTSPNNNSSSNKAKIPPEDKQVAMRQQTMRMCIPSGGGDPTDFKLIHASYASLDESVCSSIDSHTRPRSQTNGNARAHCLDRCNVNNNNDNRNNGNNHINSNSNYVNSSAHSSSDKKLLSSALTIRRLSKRSSAEEILLDEKKVEDETYTKSKDVHREKKRQSSVSFWKRAFHKKVRT